MRIYEGRRTPRGLAEVLVHEGEDDIRVLEPVLPDPPDKTRDFFEWGYRGDLPLTLAIHILKDMGVGRDLSGVLCAKFRDDFLAYQERAGFALTEETLRAWLLERGVAL